MQKIPTGRKTFGLILLAIVITPFVQVSCDRTIRRWESSVPKPEPDRDYLLAPADD